MKMKFSISLKLTIIVVVLSAIIILSLTYINISEQRNFFTRNYSVRGVELAKSFDTSISYHDSFSDIEILQQFVENISMTTPNLLLLSINIPGDDESLDILASSDTTLIGTEANTYHNQAYQQTMESGEDTTFYLIQTDQQGSTSITLITPMNLSGDIVGTYDMVFSMDKEFAVFDVQMRTLIMFSVVSLFFLIFGFLFLLRRSIVKPIITFRTASKKIGKGDLDARVDIHSRDELGELATAFNTMTMDLKKSRVKIERYNKTLEGLLKQKDEFIGQLGHDLKNPLTPLVALLPMIIEQEKDPKIKNHLQVMSGNIDYIKDLIFKTLQLAKLRSSNIQFDMQRLNLLNEVELSLKNQQLFLEEHNAKVKNNIGKDFFVTADQLRLAEVFQNLISNAVKYTPNEGGVLTIDAKRDGNFIAVSVQDNGQGMSREQLDQIFDEFYRAEKEQQGTTSTGLGLSITKRIVEKHGGKIWVESAGLGKGSTFYFTLKSDESKKK